MISNLIVFSSLFLGILFTLLYLLRPGFRARVERPKYAFLQQLSMYDKGAGSASAQTAGQHGEDLPDNSDRVCDSDNDSNNQDKIAISDETTEK